jgi:hypothetical protein
MAPDQRPPETLPDPWLFDSELLIRELDRCREMVLLIPAKDAATHFAIKIAVDRQLEPPRDYPLSVSPAPRRPTRVDETRKRTLQTSEQAQRHAD